MLYDLIEAVVVVDQKYRLSAA